MKKVISFLVLLTTLSVHAQEHNIWYFGRNAGLDFNSGAPVALSDGELFTTEGSASIADANGDLLFYTDGVTVWNQNHAIMDNGNGLMGHESSAQSALIVPWPGSSTLYYIFTTTAEGGADGFRYSVVDIEGDGGLGTVTNKNTLLHSPATEAVSATFHSNGEDIWVVSHDYNSNVFYAFLITANGVASSPETSTVGSVPDDYEHAHTIKISPDGTKLAFSVMQDGTQLFDFDAATGMVSNPVTLPNDTLPNNGPPAGDYGVEFSRSGEVLYVSTLTQLYQFDLQANDIGASGIEIHDTAVHLFDNLISALQRGPDDKIYIARSNRSNLSVIHNPDTVGFGCDFEEMGVNLTKRNFLGLPNVVLSSLTISYENPLCVGEETAFSINSPGNIENILWDFGDGNTSQETAPLYRYQQAGTYIVKLTVERQGVTRVAETTIEVSQIPEITKPPNLVLCDESDQSNAVFDLERQTPFVLDTLNSDDYTITYHTSLEQAEEGADVLPENFTNTSNPQTIYVRMEDKASGCHATTSFELIVESKPVITMPDNYTVCKGSSVELSAPEGFDAYLWSTGKTTRIINVTEAGNYTVTVNAGLCENSKTVTVHESGAPVITEINTNDWTDNQNTISILVVGIGNYEYSLDGVNYQDSPEFTNLEGGTYTIYVRDKNECGMDLEEITLHTYPKFFTPNNDGRNDTWNITSLQKNRSAKVFIFDRYGKTLTTIRPHGAGWDGIYNGKPMPSNDYWFRAEYTEATEKGTEIFQSFKANFTLKR